MSDDKHHEGIWALFRLGTTEGASVSCECECPRCWDSANSRCLCADCTDGYHDHTARAAVPAGTAEKETP